MDDKTDTMHCIMGEYKQEIQFKHLSHDKLLAYHEIIDRLFRKMRPSEIAAELGWLKGKYLD